MFRKIANRMNFANEVKSHLAWPSSYIFFCRQDLRTDPPSFDRKLFDYINLGELDNTTKKYPRRHGYNPRAAAVDHAARVFDEYQRCVGHKYDTHRFASEMDGIAACIVPIPKHWSQQVEEAREADKIAWAETDNRKRTVYQARQAARLRRPEPREILTSGALPDDAVVIWMKSSNEFLTEVGISDFTQCPLEEVCFWMPFLQGLNLVTTRGTALCEPEYRATPTELRPLPLNAEAQAFLALIDDRRDWFRNRRNSGWRPKGERTC